jgi:hypothetical protein
MESERLDGAAQDVIPGVATLPVDQGVRVGTGAKGHLDRRWHDLLASK